MLQEYEELANKIHEYQLREQRLQEQISMRGSPPPSPPPKQEASDDPPMLSPGPPLTPNTNTSALRNQPYGQRSPQTVRATNAHVKAYLPNSQVTSVSVCLTASLVLFPALYKLFFKNKRLETECFT